MYRLLSPDDDVTWLAPYKHDALYVLRKGDPWVPISDAWFEGASRPAYQEVRVLEHRGAIHTPQRPDEVQVGQVRHGGEWGCWLLGKEGALLACQCSAEDDASDSNRMCIASNIILKECHSQMPKS